ncbi:MAG: 2,3-bisphosphoglycerate-independent phosphoglycerate mutase, partial [Parcubacteria group bacterium]|nr:2,3-bisphosphoglycerate-independent phosphoglycerate mutase [Parcubacteria group bacterium]
MTKNKLILIILDGWGYLEEVENNAIAQARTPNYDKFLKKYPYAILNASGESVGLPKGQMGTSEVNHMVIGAGRVVFQEVLKIKRAIECGDIENNEAILKAIEHVKKNNSTLHLKGLISPGGVHSHQEHFYALLDLAKKNGVENVLVHVFTDGRDTLPKSAKKYVQELQDYIKKINFGKIASVAGRYYAMDRDNNDDRTEKSFNILVNPNGKKYKDACEAIDEAYKSGETDEFIKPCHIEIGEGEEGCVKSDDAVIFVNFRADRAVQMTNKFLKSKIKNLKYIAMTQYREEFDCEVAFSPEEVKNTLSEIISKADLKQLKVAETEKFNHLTYYMNCKKLKALEGEDRIMLNSNSDVKTHDEKPKMRTPDIAREIIQDIKDEVHDVIFTNLCNGDIVGHTASPEPIIKGVETIDKALGDIVREGLKKNYHIIITADHGNAEEMIDMESGEPMTAHTLNPVPFIVVSNKYSKILKNE